MESKRYLEQRRKNLIQLRDLITERGKINSKIRQVRKEMYGWDTVLMEE